MLDPSELRHFYPVIVMPSHDGKGQEHLKSNPPHG